MSPKRFGQLQGLKRFLEMKTLAAQSEMKDVGELWKLLEGMYMRLDPPVTPTRELPGMNFAEEKETEQVAPGGMGEEGQRPPWDLKY